MKSLHKPIGPAWTNAVVTVPILLLLVATPSSAAMLVYNSDSPAENSSVRSAWLAETGPGSPEHVVDFETGFTAGQNVSGSSGLFPAGLVIGSSNGSAIVVSGSGSIDGSSPVGTFALSHTAAAILSLDFSAFPVDYLAFQDIDAGNTSITVTFVGGGIVALDPIDLTGSAGNSAEFVGLVRNDMPAIARVDLTTTGGTLWGVDTIEYGAIVPAPAAFWLAGTGFLGIAIRARRRRSMPASPSRQPFTP